MYIIICTHVYMCVYICMYVYKYAYVYVLMNRNTGLLVKHIIHGHK